jgi:poly-gamma-glutamate biosynthesis protein PgsC/CapC
MIEVAITIGLIFSLLSYEIFGLAAGGIVVPGYIALMLGEPERLAGLFFISVLTFLVIKIISQYTFLYGRRQLVVSILIGAILANLSRLFFSFQIASVMIELQAVGWVIPGLIAHWFVKQGVFKTLSVVVVISVLVRLIIVLLFNGDPVLMLGPQ